MHVFVNFALKVVSEVNTSVFTIGSHCYPVQRDAKYRTYIDTFDFWMLYIDTVIICE